MKADDLFARHLDLTPLRGRRRGLVHCRFHQDREVSLSIDLDRGVFHCFGCGLGGGVKRFAQLVGEHLDCAPTRAPCQQPHSPLEEARTRVIAEAGRQRARLEPYRDLVRTSDFIRDRFQLTDRSRRVATVLGPSPRVWGLLAHASKLETGVLALEAEVDAILAEGRVA